MKARTKLSIWNQFPDFTSQGFSQSEFEKVFCNENVIVNAKANNIAYPAHSTSLSIKCAFGGQEIYKGKNFLYAVNDENFLVLNKGTIYNSFIASNPLVESFTIHFADCFLELFRQSRVISHETSLDNPADKTTHDIQFMERLYRKDFAITPLILRVRQLVNLTEDNNIEIEEKLCEILELLIKNEISTRKEIQLIDVVKQSTKVEIYSRLYRAKDFIDSCFLEKLSLQDIASIACMNQFYFLRQFKKVFHRTPVQYLQENRLKKARQLLTYSEMSIKEVCWEVGYTDLAAFSKLFKIKSKCSPSNFRKITAAKNNILTGPSY